MQARARVDRTIRLSAEAANQSHYCLFGQETEDLELLAEKQLDFYVECCMIREEGPENSGRSETFGGGRTSSGLGLLGGR